MLYMPYMAKYLKDVMSLTIPQIGLLQAFQRSNQEKGNKVLHHLSRSLNI